MLLLGVGFFLFGDPLLDGRDHFDRLVKIDLERNRDWHRVFDGDLDAGRIRTELEVLTDQSIDPGESLLFLDEIQSCPRAIMALRYFHEELPDLHVIAAGSLLEFAIADIPFPVGRIQVLDMHPMTFAEYLRATGQDRLADIVLGVPSALPDSVQRTPSNQGNQKAAPGEDRREAP